MLALSGCTAEFLLGEGTGDTTAAADGAGATTSMGPTTSSGAEGSSLTDPTATQGSSSGAAEGTTEVTGGPGSTTTGGDTGAESSTTESATTLETTTTDPTGGGGGVLDCPDVADARSCEAESSCDWYGEVCFADRCHPDAEAACNELAYEPCLGAPLCTWFGEPDVGECGITPCIELTFEPCSLAAGCAWMGDMELGECVVPECPPCAGLEEPGCLELPDDCTWFDAAAVCVPD